MLEVEMAIAFLRFVFSLSIGLARRLFPLVEGHARLLLLTLSFSQSNFPPFLACSIGASVTLSIVIM